MPVDLSNLRSRLSAALADRRISTREAEALADTARRDGLAPEEAALLRDALRLHRDAFEPAAAAIVSRAVESSPSPPNPPGAAHGANAANAPAAAAAAAPAAGRRDLPTRAC